MRYRSPVLELTVAHELDCTPSRFWDLFFDPEFTREMIVDGLGFARCDIDPIQQDGKVKRRHMFVEPKVDLPGPVAKLLGPKLGYDEQGNYDEETGLWTFEYRLSVLSERIKMGGKLRVEPVGDDRCKRIADLWIEARILGVGKMVEKAGEKNMRDGWNRSAQWMNGYLQRHPDPARQ